MWSVGRWECRRCCLDALNCVPHRESLQKLLGYAKASLAEDAVRFAISLVVIEARPRGKSHREETRKMCVELLARHFGDGAPYRLDVTKASEDLSTAQVCACFRREAVCVPPLYCSR